MSRGPVLIVGAGVAGLSCANVLHRAGRSFLLLDASDQVGGRVRSDVTEDGFILDRGFQVLLTSYPEVRRQLALDALHPCAFRSGALIRLPDGSQTLLRDPLRDPWALPSALLSPIGSLSDKLRIAKFVTQLLRQHPDTLLARPAGDTLGFLREQGWSQQIISHFFIPFFGGVFLDRALSADRNFFAFVFQQFVLGRAVLPSKGMQSIPEQLAAKLPSSSLLLRTPVASVHKDGVRLKSGDWLAGSAVVLAADGAQASQLLPSLPVPGAWRRTTCFYFAAPGKPGWGNGYLHLNASPEALVHNVCFPSDVAPHYAPVGQTLVSVSSHSAQTAPSEQMLHQIRLELRDWFGPAVDQWKHLRTYDLPQALPSTTARPAGAILLEGVHVCGDYTSYPSLNAALATGRLVGECLLSGN